MPLKYFFAAFLAGLPATAGAQSDPVAPEPPAATAPEYDSPGDEPPLSFGEEVPDDVAEPPMTLERMGRILHALDPELQSAPNAFQLTIREVTVIVVFDEAADRMRAIAPVRPAEGLEEAELIRMMQANFDSALDARYAIAQEALWAAFIHPLSPLERDEMISGIGQVVNLVQSYGTLYSGGGLVYGGGDSQKLQRELIDELLEKGQEI